MPILKYRSIAELDAHRRAQWCDAPDTRWFVRVARLWERSARLNPRRFPTGVHRYRSAAESDAAREAWLEEHVRRLHAERRRDR